MANSPSLTRVERVDLALADALALDPDRILGRAVATFAELGDQPPLRTISLLMLAAGAVTADRRRFRVGLRMLAAHSFATLTKSFVKDSVDRTRPGTALDECTYRLRAGNSRAHRMQSMPSGHSAGTVAIACCLVSDFPETAKWVAISSAAIIGAQLPSRNHYFSDLAVGAGLGLIAFGLTELFLPSLRPPGQDYRHDGDAFA